MSLKSSIKHFFGALTQRSDVMLLGDTNHTDPEIKGHVVELLPELMQGGVTSLWLEVDHQHQQAFDTFLSENPQASPEQYQQFFRETTKLRSADAYGTLTYAAHAQGLDILFADNKGPANAVRERFPDYTAIRRQVRSHIEQGGLPAREQYLATLKPEVRAEYEEAYAQWKDARDVVNPEIAQRLIEHQKSKGGKAVLLIGNEHMNSDKDIDEHLGDAGLRVSHVDLYRNQQDCFNDIRRIVAETGKATMIPEYAYLMNESRIVRSADLLAEIQADDAKQASTPDLRVDASLANVWRYINNSLGLSG